MIVHLPDSCIAPVYNTFMAIPVLGKNLGLVAVNYLPHTLGTAVAYFLSLPVNTSATKLIFTVFEQFIYQNHDIGINFPKTFFTNDVIAST